MIWKRLKNLWELSKYSPRTDKGLNVNEMILRQEVFEKKKQRLATIIEDKPDLFSQ